MIKYERGAAASKLIIPDHLWNDLWLTKFCLTNNLGKSAQDDLREWVIQVFLFMLLCLFANYCVYFVLQRCGSRDSNNQISTARTIYDRIKSKRVYPDIQGYKLSKTHTVEDVPENFNGPHGDPIHFRCANMMEVIVSLLKKTSLHGEYICM